MRKKSPVSTISGKIAKNDTSFVEIVKISKFDAKNTHTARRQRTVALQIPTNINPLHYWDKKKSRTTSKHFVAKKRGRGAEGLRSISSQRHKRTSYRLLDANAQNSAKITPRNKPTQVNVRQKVLKKYLKVEAQMRRSDANAENSAIYRPQITATPTKIAPAKKEAQHSQLDASRRGKKEE